MPPTPTALLKRPHRPTREVLFYPGHRDSQALCLTSGKSHKVLGLYFTIHKIGVVPSAPPTFIGLFEGQSVEIINLKAFRRSNECTLGINIFIIAIPIPGSASTYYDSGQLCNPPTCVPCPLRRQMGSRLCVDHSLCLEYFSAL